MQVEYEEGFISILRKKGEETALTLSPRGPKASKETRQQPAALAQVSAAGQEAAGGGQSRAGEAGLPEVTT